MPLSLGLVTHPVSNEDFRLNRLRVDSPPMCSHNSSFHAPPVPRGQTDSPTSHWERTEQLSLLQHKEIWDIPVTHNGECSTSEHMVIRIWLCSVAAHTRAIPTPETITRVNCKADMPLGRSNTCLVKYCNAFIQIIHQFPFSTTATNPNTITLHLRNPAVSHCCAKHRIIKSEEMGRMLKNHELSLARSYKSVERLILFLAKSMSLFQGNLVIFLYFSKMEFKVTPWQRQPDTCSWNCSCSCSAIEKAH